MPWSHSALEDFKNCPKAFHAKRVAKTVKEEQSDAIIWGNKVHTAFEERIRDSTPLPDYLQEHEPFMQELADLQGQTFAEQKIALDTRMQPTTFFAKDVWMRGVIDFLNVHGDGALVVDYKTGKPHSDMGQLKLSALHTFAAYPEVQFVTVKYYWTKTCSDEPEETYTRDQIREMWSEFVPDLKQYVEAFKTDTWQARPSGLCNGWCPVTSCEHWKPKRGGR